MLQHPLFWLGVLEGGRLWRTGRQSPGTQLWIGNFFLWSAVYLTAVYWHRFALPALFLASPLAASFLRHAATRLSAAAFRRPPRWLAPGIIASFLALFYPLAGLDYLEQILTCQGSTPLRLVQYLRSHVPRHCLIETPEYELAFLDDDHRIHLMPSFFFKEATPDRVMLLNPRKRPYEFNRVGADILILGSFGKSVFKQVYPPARIKKEWRRVGRVDYYDIYIARKSEKRMLKLMHQTLASTRREHRSELVKSDNAQGTLVNTYYH